MKLKFALPLILLGAAITSCAMLVTAQDGKPTPIPASPTPHPGDVASRDAIVAALYDSISGPAGDRDWERFRALFFLEAQLIATFKKKDGTPGHKAMTVEGYVDSAGKYFKEHGFYEHEISRKVETFGSITHIFSTYESRETKDGKPFDRGINSIQLYNDGSRWWWWTSTGPAKHQRIPSPSNTCPRPANKSNQGTLGWPYC